MARHRSFTAEFKAQVVLEVISGARTGAEVCREHNIKPQLLSTWKAQFVQNAPSIFESGRGRDETQERIVELERLLGQKTLELAPRGYRKKASHILQSHQTRNGRL